MRHFAVLVASQRARSALVLHKEALLAGLALSALAICHPVHAQSSSGNRCRDYGSFGVVDAPAPRRGEPIVAQPFQPCADLPGAPQPQIFIDAQVNWGGNQTEADNGTGSGTGSGWRPRPEQPIVRPPQKPPVWSGPVQPRPYRPVSPH
jgi:hypothetical protein